ncbi:hypothetical protein E2C01_029322 [Portunus trituberculatus]|uniref:Uncharacterized protein n=1 Tax=Portunus trituberculatus TaxID=210409 RepID=A0A5B7ER60_PORTR|nr:hypothetical protein [Portunus trituberculatus]
MSHSVARLCRGPMELQSVTHQTWRHAIARLSLNPTTTLRHTIAPLSLDYTMTGLNTVEPYPKALVTLSCPLVTTAARVAVAEKLPIPGVDFLLGNVLAGGRVWVHSPPAALSAPPVVQTVTRSQAKRAKKKVVVKFKLPFATIEEEAGQDPEIVGAAVSPSRVNKGKGLDVDYEGMTGSSEEDPHESAPYGGGTHAELSPGLAAGCPGTQSRPQLGELDHSDGATAEGSEVTSSAGELDPPVSAECAGGEEPLAPLPGDCLLEDSLVDGPVSVADDGADGSLPPQSPAQSVDGLGLPLPSGPESLPALHQLTPQKLVLAQQEYEGLAPYYARLVSLIVAARLAGDECEREREWECCDVIPSSLSRAQGEAKPTSFVSVH